MKTRSAKLQLPEQLASRSSNGSARAARAWNLVFLWSLVLGVWGFSSGGVRAQTPLSNLVVTVGTTTRDGASHDWSYVLIGAPDAQVLAGKRFAVYGKAGYPTNAGTFTLRGTLSPQTDTAAINTLLNNSVSLGQNLTTLDHALAYAVRSNLVVGLLHAVPGITNQSLPQKVATAVTRAATDASLAEALDLMGHGNPGLALCLGHALAEQITTTTTYEVREANPGTGVAGDVVGRVTLVPGAPVVLPAPGPPFQLKTNAPSDHLRIRLRWGAPPELLALSPLQFGYNVWRIPKSAAIAGGFDVTPPTPAGLNSNPNFIRANTTTAVMATKQFYPGAESDPSDTTTFFFADNGRATLGTNFTAGSEFYYFITARDLLGRDGLVSQGELAIACRRLPPVAPDGLQVENAILPGSTNQPRLRVVWTQNTNATEAVDQYWVYRWTNPSSAYTNNATPTSNRIAVVSQIVGTNVNSFLDNTPGARTNANATNVWYTIRAVTTDACDPLLSPHSPPAWGVLRDWSAPDATTGTIVGSCGTPVVRFQGFATNTINADTQAWNFRLTCLRRDRGIAWVQFTITNTAAFGGPQVTTVGPVYFPPGGDRAQLDYPVAAYDTAPHTFSVSCVVGTGHGPVSPLATATTTTPFPSDEQHEIIFYAGELLATALSSSDPLLAVLNNGNTVCYPANNVAPDASGMVSMRFNVAPGTPLLVQAFSNGNWSDVALVTGDADSVYWVRYPACLIGPLPQFQGCVANLPGATDCDQYTTSVAAGGAIAPLRIRFRLTPRTHEYRVYRRVDDGPLTLLAAGAAIYDAANPNKILETSDDAMPVVPARLCYFVQTLDQNGNGSPLAFLGCKEVSPGALPQPVLSEPQPAGTELNPQVVLNWFCPTAGVSRFLVTIKRTDPEVPAKPSEIASPQLTRYPSFNQKAIFLGLDSHVHSVTLRYLSFDAAFLTPKLSAGFGPGPQFTLTASVIANVHYALSVAAVSSRDPTETQLSDVRTFVWNVPYVPQDVPWPARALPPVRNFEWKGDTNVVVAALLEDANQRVDERYPVGIRIGEMSDNPNDLGIQSNVRLDTYASYTVYNGYLNPDPNTYVFRRKGSGEPLLPIVVYRQQLTNSLFPKVSGAVVQVSPLIERVPWILQPTSDFDIVTIPDRLFAINRELEFGPDNSYPLYLRDQQPVLRGARYRYFVAHFNDQREVEEIIPAGEVTVDTSQN